jgi:hypothetical protein
LIAFLIDSGVIFYGDFKNDIFEFGKPLFREIYEVFFDEK